ncbi:MAG: hypothetical protein P4M11_10690 [Candidatus Pacebacteria bacterium]|nr:hypothetical protein [Candidatus Paceibacterota bacterium]
MRDLVEQEDSEVPAENLLDLLGNVFDFIMLSSNADIVPPEPSISE